jgi:hypothetical protein
MRAPVATALAIAFGLIVLLGYFIPTGEVGRESALYSLFEIRSLIIGGAVTLAGFATLVAIFGLVGTHWHKLRAPKNPDRYSLFMLIGFFLALGYGVFVYTFDTSLLDGFQQMVSAVLVPVEASLMAVLAVVLTLAIVRLFQRRRGILAVSFLVSGLVFLLYNSGLLQRLVAFPDWLLEAIHMLPVAGGRGILLGIALGSLMAGLRILFGAERPYSG